jgi:2-C-methyl-D-erythritol 2,4-cyclodiphosphate synthase
VAEGFRIGLGFDVHAAQVGRPLRLGGVELSDGPGLAGHSDADVVCHAVADALLGAAGLGDLGRHFPESDPSVEGIAGLDLLTRVAAMVRQAGYRTSSCDATVIADRPAIAPHAQAMRDNLAGALGADADAVSVKATRPEGLGLSGDGAGCIAVALLERA